MKTLILFFFALLATANLMAQQTVNDTLIIEKPNQITLAQHDDTLSIKVQGKENQPDYLLEREVVLDPKAEVRTSQTHTTSSPLNWDFSHIEGRDSLWKIRRALTPCTELRLTLEIFIKMTHKTSWLTGQIKNGFYFLSLHVFRILSPESSIW